MRICGYGSRLCVRSGQRKSAAGSSLGRDDESNFYPCLTKPDARSDVFAQSLFKQPGPSFKAKGMAPLRAHIIVGYGRPARGSGEHLRTVFDQVLRTLIGRGD